MCGQQRRGVEVDGVAADRLHARDARLDQRLAEVGGGADPVAQVVLVDHLAQPLGDRLEVAPGQAAVGGESLRQDQQVAGRIGPARRR